VGNKNSINSDNNNKIFYNFLFFIMSVGLVSASFFYFCMSQNHTEPPLFASSSWPTLIWNCFQSFSVHCLSHSLPTK